MLRPHTRGMSNLWLSEYFRLRAVLKERRDLALENLALRQQTGSP